MARRQRDPAKEAFWRKALQRFVSSGLSVREFCKREQVTESAFYAWRRTIGQRGRHKRLRARVRAGRGQRRSRP